MTDQQWKWPEGHRVGETFPISAALSCGLLAIRGIADDSGRIGC
jgi:hypothetical protein